MYEVILFLHSWLRWLLVAVLVISIVKFLAAAMSGKGWTGADKKLKIIAVASADLQLVLGLLLYWLSPVTQAALESMKEAMKNAPLRFFAVEHPPLMLLAIILLHVGSVVIKRSQTDKQRHLRGLFFFTIALALIFGGTPWPSLSYGRPLFRF